MASKTGDDVVAHPPPADDGLGPVVDDEKDHFDDTEHSKAMDRVINFAKTATEKEHKMTLLQGVKLYPKAIAWSMLISTCIVMEG